MRQYPRYAYKEAYYFDKHYTHRSRDTNRRNSRRDSHHDSRACNYSRHERKYPRDYRTSPNTRRAPSTRAESRVDSHYADYHDNEGHVLVNLGGDLTPRCKSHDSRDTQCTRVQI